MKDLLKPRTLIAFLFYATFCYLILTKAQIPQELNSIVSILMGFYFGNKNKNGGQNGKENNGSRGS
jgi:hypothetical protein